MKVRPEQLSSHLSKGLAPIYVLSGDEPLQLEESLDQLRAKARKDGFDERVVLHVETGFDWSTLAAYQSAMSLFSEKRVIDLRMPGGKPGKVGTQALVDYAERPNPDAMLLVSLGKVDRRETSSRWHKALEQAGVGIQSWPVAPRDLTRWIDNRAKSRGITLNADAIRLLAERIEGNLLACAQEIDKLALIHGEAKIDAEQLLESVGNSARYSVFSLLDSALMGRADRVARILNGLREEGEPTAMIAWWLVRETRTLAGVASAMARGTASDAAMSEFGVWSNRKPLIKRTIDRIPSGWWPGVLKVAERCDASAKGWVRTNAWNEIEVLALALAGVDTRGVLSHPSTR